VEYIFCNVERAFCCYAAYDVTTTISVGRHLVALNGRAAKDAIIGVGKDNYLFKVFGRVTVIDPDTFTLDDGSGTLIRVVAPDHVPLSNGDYASASGDLDNTITPIVMQSSQEGVVKLN
jgi:hypothetical protein